MKTQQRYWTSDRGWSEPTGDAPQSRLVLAFGPPAVVSRSDLRQQVQAWYPQADAVICSTAGEIAGIEVLDDSLVVTALQFEDTRHHLLQAQVSGPTETEAVARDLAGRLDAKDLVHVLVFSDGLKVNGTTLARGLRESLPATVAVTGGLVGDGPNFKTTLIGVNEAPSSGQIVLIGLYGQRLRVGFGSMGGWDSFGPSRLITRSASNVLFELDHQPALELYKKYLGDHATRLPASGLLFPLSLEEPNVVRTLLGVDEAAQSMTFAGDMPEGSRVKLMKANFERLIDGAAGAASRSQEKITTGNAEFALLISCIGRKLVLNERTEEELEAVQGVLGEQATLTGFYSYGEICPTAASENQCDLHNQTMTITTLAEA